MLPRGFGKYPEAETRNREAAQLLLIIGGMRRMRAMRMYPPVCPLSLLGVSVPYLVSLFCLLLLAAPPASGQERQEPPAAGGTLKVSTNVVNVYAVVKDKKGHLIPNLQKEDFELLDEKARQEIRYFSRETDTPLTLGIMVDTSPSQEGVLSVEKEQAKSFLRQILRPKDMAFVIHFDLEVELLQDFTADFPLLAHAIDETVINGGGRGVLPSPVPTASVGGTHLYDSVYLASTELLKNEVGRKVLILLTDGEDEGSKVKLEAALEVAQKSDVMIYSIDISDRMFYLLQGRGFQGDSVLKKLSEETGGRVLQVQRLRDTAAAFQQIADELRTQYLLGYTPTHIRREGSFRRIHVQVRNTDYKVQARRGYYAPTE
jgi:VWFA-related protein